MAGGFAVAVGLKQLQNVVALRFITGRTDQLSTAILGGKTRLNGIEHGKRFFRKEWREVVHYNDLTGEKHIADVKSINGYVLEFQNSPMNSLEMKSRESFYKKLIWIVNAQKFINNFFIKDKLPDPTCELAKEVRFVNSNYPVFVRHEIPY